jgi:DnaK suppressor protein
MAVSIEARSGAFRQKNVRIKTQRGSMVQPGELLLHLAAGYNRRTSVLILITSDWISILKDSSMEVSKLEHFKQLLLAELPGHARHVSEEQAAALDAASDDAKESADLAMRDVTEEMALKLGDRESQMLADIDQALLRIEEGSYGVCVHCGRPIEERRLEAMPTARYDAECQAAIEAGKGKSARPTL